MAGKVLTDEDFKGGGEDPNPDTSDKGKEIPKDELIPADQKFDQDGKKIVEEPGEKETPTDKGKGDEPSPKPSDEKAFKPKHKSWEETESARVEAERKMHEATTRASTYERELAEFRKPPPAKTPTIDDRISEISDAAYDEIARIPVERDAEGNFRQESLIKRDKEAARIWAKANRKISRLEIDEDRKKTQTEHDVVSKTLDRATKEGIKTDAELRILGYEYNRTDPNLDVDSRITRAIESTKGILGQVREGFIEKQAQDLKEKDELKVLGRGGNRPGKGKEESKETKSSTMSQQLTEMNESRRLKKDDLWH